MVAKFNNKKRAAAIRDILQNASDSSGILLSGAPRRQPCPISAPTHRLSLDFLLIGRRRSRQTEISRRFLG
jgi:hypothetical protein